MSILLVEKKVAARLIVATCVLLISWTDFCFGEDILEQERDDCLRQHASDLQ
jgi:hypothetical protein